MTKEDAKILTCSKEHFTFVSKQQFLRHRMTRGSFVNQSQGEYITEKMGDMGVTHERVNLNYYIYIFKFLKTPNSVYSNRKTIKLTDISEKKVIN